MYFKKVFNNHNLFFPCPLCDIQTTTDMSDCIISNTSNQFGRVCRVYIDCDNAIKLINYLSILNDNKKLKELKSIDISILTSAITYPIDKKNYICLILKIFNLHVQTKIKIKKYY